MHFKKDVDPANAQDRIVCSLKKTTFTCIRGTS